MWITWTHDSSQLSWPLTFPQKVELFYEQALGWQLHIADVVANGGVAFGDPGDRNGGVVPAIRHSGFAVLQICLSYFETVGRYSGTYQRDSDAFKAGVRLVFPELAAADPDLAKALVDELYKGGRCGLYHNVRTTSVGLGIVGESAIFFDTASKRVAVNPHRLPARLKAHLDSFRAQLLDLENAGMVAAFESQFSRDSGAA